MDGSQYGAQNGLNNGNSPYGQPGGGISLYQLQNQNLPAHTLPPLQPSQHATMQSLHGSAPHTPRTPATPNTPGSANTMGNFPQMGGQPRGYQMMQNNYQQASQQYRTSSSMMPQTSTAMSHPQPIAPAPAQNRMPQQLRPMPPNGLQQNMGGMQSPYGQGTMSLVGPLSDMEPPTHVVGSQGRRGILPSAPGRPPVGSLGTGTGKNALIPAKDADGKFPCPHCTKTYLHAKHLKRHLLRHTGDRPYMCVLCRDTFSRSDILKRHFQKCSIRRGNPTGASHLSHAQAHLKKSHPGPHKPSGSMSNENDLMGANNNGMGNGQSSLPLFGVIPDGSVPDAGSNLTDEQAEQLSRSNSMKRLSAGGMDGRGMTGSLPGGPGRSNFQGYAGGGASTMAPGMNPSLAFSVSQGQNGHSYSQGYNYASHGNNTNVQSQPASQDWSQMFPAPHEGYTSQYNPNLNASQISIKPKPASHEGYTSQYNSNLNAPQISIKSEPAINPTTGLFTGLYPNVTNPVSTSQFPAWNLQNDPLEEISSRLIYFCFANNQIIGRSNDIRKYLSASNIKHFIEHFTSFQGHFPMIHVPTFRIADAFEGLLLAMICIGSVYSDRMTPTEVRDMMEFAKAIIERNSPIFTNISREQNGDSGFGGETIGSSRLELEQITAIFMMQVLFTWNGTPVQREKARREFPLIAEIARRAGLTKSMTISPFSVLHQPNVTVENFNAASFDWNAWVEQEKRSRLMFTIFLVDASMVMYFNTQPRFDREEIRLPLPADDAAWDAPNATECAEALGLRGPETQRSRNPEGSRRKKQPEMHTALRALMHPSWDLQPGTTNLYSKFLLVHALHVQLWTAQRQSSMQESGQMNAPPPTFPRSGTSTPLSQNDWVRGVDSGSATHSANTSGRVTPVENGTAQSSQILKTINNAFDKWKKSWDEDMLTQYPPSSARYRRFGFCRDGVHFFWLAKYLIKNNRALDWQTAPDQRFSQIMNLLTSVKTWVISDSSQRGEELGSVSDIDKDYGVTDLTLDMAQLFKPINKQIDSPVPGVHTNIGNGLG